MRKKPKLRAVLAAAVMILAGLGYLVAQYMAFMADPNPRGTLPEVGFGDCESTQSREVS
jgi:hypothetical protein